MQQRRGQMKANQQKDDEPLARLKHRVFQPIKEKIYVPLNRLIDRLGYFSSALLLVVILGVTSLTIRFWNHPEEGRRAVTVVRFYLDARHAAPPRNPHVNDVIRDLTNQLKDTISPSNRNRTDVGGDWVEAQMAISLQGQDAFDPIELVQWFHKEAESCHGCWRAELQGPEHLGTVGWVLLAFAQMRASPNEQEVAFVLANQHRPGWWPVYPASDNPRNASTYATALCIWGLEELLERDLITGSQKQLAIDAVRKGRNWLMNNTIAEKPGRWKDYPNGEYGHEAIGLSGLALHALHRTPGPSPSANDTDWMANLPFQLPAPQDNFASGQTVYLTDRVATQDPTHYFAFPWVIIATNDAYSRGSLSQKAQAARLFHEIPEKRNEIVTGVKDMPWLAAEILIALRYLEGEIVI